MVIRGTLLLLLFSCWILGVACGPREPDKRMEQLRDLAEQFVHAAAGQDTLAIQRLAVSDPRLMNRLKYWWSNEPDLLAAAVGKLRPRAVSTKGTDSLYGELEFPYRARREVIAVGLVRTGSTWRLYFIGLPDRL